jgi:hypothetical protein
LFRTKKRKSGAMKKIFFRALFYIKNKEKKFFRFHGFARFRNFTDHHRTPADTYGIRSGPEKPQHRYAISGSHHTRRVRSLLPRPNSKSIETVRPRRPKATRPSV